MNAFMSNAGKAIPKVIKVGQSCRGAFDDDTLFFKGYYKLTQGRFWRRLALALQAYGRN